MATAKRKSARKVAKRSASKPARKSAIKSARKSDARSVTVAALKRAVEGRNARALADMYAQDAVMLVSDHDNPPSNPHRLQGKDAIAGYFSDVCGRDMTHMIENGVSARVHPKLHLSGRHQSVLFGDARP